MMNLDRKSTSPRPRSRRKSAFYLFAITALIISFQNCGGSFDAASSASGSNASSSAIGGSSTSGGSTSGGASTGTDPEAVQRMINDCKAIQDKPTLLALTDASTLAAVSTVNVNSAMSTLSGDTTNTDAQNLKLSFNSAITDSAKNASLGCNIQPRFSCDLITDGSKPLSINRGIDINGVQVGTGANLSTSGTIAGGTFSRNDCTSMNNLTATTKTFRLITNQNNQNRYYCVQGEATIKISMRTRFSVVVNGNAQNFDSAVSDPIYLKVTLTDKCWTESRLTGPASYPGASEAGRVSAIDGNWAAVVAPYETLTSPVSVHKAGAAYMFEKVGSVWTYRQKITLPNVAAVDTISAAALSGSRLALGTDYRASERGSVFIYRLDSGSNQWVNMQEIQPDVTGSPQRFGASLFMNSGTLVVGSPRNSTGAIEGGRVYIYDCSGDSCTSTPRATYTGSVLGAGLGSSVAVSGGLVAMGAPGTEFYVADPADGFSNGYVAVRNYAGASGNTLVGYAGSLTISDTNSVGSRFGSSVAISGNRVAIGARSRKGTSAAGATLTEAGAMYYYANYSTTTTPRAVMGNVNLGKLGASLAMTTTGVLMSCPACAGGKTQAESAGVVNFYSFTNLDSTNTIATANHLFALDETRSAIFGQSLGVSGNNIIVGASGRNNPFDNGGAVYIYEMK